MAGAGDCKTSSLSWLLLISKLSRYSEPRNIHRLGVMGNRFGSPFGAAKRVDPIDTFPRHVDKIQFHRHIPQTLGNRNLNEFQSPSLGNPKATLLTTQ